MMGVFEILVIAAILAAVVLLIIHFSKRKSDSGVDVTLLTDTIQHVTTFDNNMNETKNCPYCGEEILAGAKKCKHCGEWLEEEPKPVTVKPEPQSPITVMARPTEQRFSQPIVINNTVSSRSNGIGTAGFVLALISAIFCWVPGVNWIIWFLGALFSFIGLFKRPRGMAVAGFILSIIDVIIIVVVIGAVVGVASSLFS